MFSVEASSRISYLYTIYNTLDTQPIISAIQFYSAPVQSSTLTV